MLHNMSIVREHAQLLEAVEQVGESEDCWTAIGTDNILLKVSINSVLALLGSPSNSQFFSASIAFRSFFYFVHSYIAFSMLCFNFCNLSSPYVLLNQNGVAFLISKTKKMIELDKWKHHLLKLIITCKLFFIS